MLLSSVLPSGHTTPRKIYVFHHIFCEIHTIGGRLLRQHAVSSQTWVYQLWLRTTQPSSHLHLTSCIVLAKSSTCLTTRLLPPVDDQTTGLKNPASLRDREQVELPREVTTSLKGRDDSRTLTCPQNWASLLDPSDRWILSQNSSVFSWLFLKIPINVRRLRSFVLVGSFGRMW